MLLLRTIVFVCGLLEIVRRECSTICFGEFLKSEGKGTGTTIRFTLPAQVRKAAIEEGDERSAV